MTVTVAWLGLAVPWLRVAVGVLNLAVGVRNLVFGWPPHAAMEMDAIAAATAVRLRLRALIASPVRQDATGRVRWS